MMGCKMDEGMVFVLIIIFAYLKVHEDKTKNAFPQSSSNDINGQDVNRDNTLSETEKNKTQTPRSMDTSSAELKKLLADNKNMGEVLNILQQTLPNENTVIMFLAEYNQIMGDIEIGLSDFNSREWKSLKHRIMQFIDRKKDEL